MFVDDAAELARRYPHTIVTNSLSKSNALTGLAPRLDPRARARLSIEAAIKVHAWAHVVRRHVRAARRAARLLNAGSSAEHAAGIANSRDELLAALRESGLRFIEPEGSVLRLRAASAGDASSLEAANELIERYDVVAIPGIAFGECDGEAGCA